MRDYPVDARFVDRIDGLIAESYYQLMGLPLQLYPHFTAYYSITVDGLSLHQGNPVPYLDDLPPELRPVFTYANGCSSCHQFRGWGPRAGHVNLWSGKMQGGYVLPLEDYPPEVWRSFVFNQRHNATLIGAIPNMVAPKAQQALYQIVEQSRQQRPAQRTGH